MKNLTKTTVLAALIAGLALVPSAKASISIGYSVGAASDSVGGDTVALAANPSGSVTLTPNGSSVNALLNNVDWTVTKTDGSGTYTDTLDRSMTITLAVGSQTLSQDVSLKIKIAGNSDHQTLDIAASSPVDFTWTDGISDYDLQVTALAMDELVWQGSQNQLPTDVSGKINGSFKLTSLPASNGQPSPVPEPATIVSGALLLLPFGMSAFRIMRKSRTA